VSLDVCRAFSEKGVEIHGCPKVQEYYANNNNEGVTIVSTSEDDWSTKYLAPILSVKIVDGLEEAVQHINHYGSGHTDGIITCSLERSRYFVNTVDSASVLVNASTRLSGGGDYGMGTIVGISTDKLHARGPMGPSELTTYKWVAYGQGHLRG
jgi:glutamate-5-semialdehyde dehydrogenase